MESRTSEQQLAPQRAEKQRTAYVILQQEANGGWWPVSGVDTEPIEAGSAKAAIKTYLDHHTTLDESDLVGASFVAVPKRSWSPRSIGGVEEVPAKRQFKLD